MLQSLTTVQASLMLQSRGEKHSISAEKKSALRQ